MTRLFDALQELLEAGKTAVTATVTACEGATPRSPGATMLVAAGMPALGTVGGGQAEYYAAQQAEKMILPGSPAAFTASYECLSAEELHSMGKEAGGEITVLFLRWSAQQLPLARMVRAALTANADASLRISYRPESWYGELTGTAVTFSAPGVFCMKLAEAGLCYVFGGGHVSQALVPLLSGIDFTCVVLDERPEFANPAVFPAAAKTYSGSLPFLAKEANFGRGDLVIIMTRGHQGDYEVLTEALRSPAWYIGMVGSHRKMEATFRRLREDGFSERELARIVTPIGLDIDAETPNEIAVSVAAQLIRCRAAHRCNITQ